MSTVPIPLPPERGTPMFEEVVTTVIELESRTAAAKLAQGDALLHAVPHVDETGGDRIGLAKFLREVSRDTGLTVDVLDTRRRVAYRVPETTRERLLKAGVDLSYAGFRALADYGEDRRAELVDALVEHTLPTLHKHPTANEIRAHARALSLVPDDHGTLDGRKTRVSATRVMESTERAYHQTNEAWASTVAHFAQQIKDAAGVLFTDAFTNAGDLDTFGRQLARAKAIAAAVDAVTWLTRANDNLVSDTAGEEPPADGGLERPLLPGERIAAIEDAKPESHEPTGDEPF